MGGVVSASDVINDDRTFKFGAIEEDGLIAKINMYGCRLDKFFVPGIPGDEYRIDTKRARFLLDEGQVILRDDWERVPRDKDGD